MYSATATLIPVSVWAVSNNLKQKKKKERQTQRKATEGEKMTGENFKRLHRRDTTLEKMIADLDALREKWSEEYHKQDDDGNYIFNNEFLNAITAKIERLKNCIYAYVYNRNTIEYTREFAKKHLW
jgi:uncharacterized protein with von Willebrand factor type A (vWA) domain